MAIAYYTTRPDVAAAVQWTGSNFAEVQDVLRSSTFITDAVDNGDGTITLTDFYRQVLTVPTGNYVTNKQDAGGSSIYTADPFAGNAGYQTVTGMTVDYTVN